MVSERNVHILFCRHIWAELSLLFWTFLSGTFFPGGGVHVHPVHPPAYAPAERPFRNPLLDMTKLCIFNNVKTVLIYGCESLKQPRQQHTSFRLSLTNACDPYLLSSGPTNQKRGTVGKDRARKSGVANSTPQMGLDRLHTA